MKNIRIVVAAAAAAVVSLAACSNAPSDSEIKKAIASASLKDGCKAVFIEDVKKLNGMKVDDNNYLIKSEFALAVKKDSSYLELYQAYKSSKDETNSINKKLGEDLAPLVNNVSEISKDRDLLVNSINREMDDYQREAVNKKIEEIREKLSEARSRLDQAQFNAQKEIAPYQEKDRGYRNAMNRRHLEILEECVDFQKKAHLALELLGYANNHDAQGNSALINGAKKSYNFEFTMIKTDNGWVYKL